jgi:hypothetical protein
MHKSWSMCVLLGALAWGQAAPPAPSAQPRQALPPNAAAAPKAPAAPENTSAAVPPDAPVLTIKGVCPPAPKTAATKTATAKAADSAAKSSTDAASKTSTADCKTVITRAEFEKIASALAPNMTPQLKNQLATVLPRVMAMSQAAEKKGLDKEPQFKERMKFAKMQILSQELQQNIQEEASKVPQQEIADYYKKNPEAYEQYNLDRLFVPRMKQTTAEEKSAEEKENEKEEKLTEEQQKAKEAEEKAKEEQGEQEMTKLAETLRARAAAGEDLTKLQKEAFEAAGMKIESPTVNLPKVRRTGLPPGHSAVFELKPGEVSQVINDSGGHYIYKLNAHDELPLDQVESEIKSTLQSQRTHDAMDKYQNSFQVDTNQAYFGPATAGGMRPGMPPPRGGQRPNMPPSATPTQQTPPPAQPPASKPD